MDQTVTDSVYTTPEQRQKRTIIRISYRHRQENQNILRNIVLRLIVKGGIMNNRKAHY